MYNKKSVPFYAATDYAFQAMSLLFLFLAFKFDSVHVLVMICSGGGKRRGKMQKCQWQKAGVETKCMPPADKKKMRQQTIKKNGWKIYTRCQNKKLMIFFN